MAASKSNGAQRPVFTLANWANRVWYGDARVASILLWPLSGLFAVIGVIRRVAYRAGWMASQRLPVPVVVVGNLTVGGAGKTPLTLYLAQQLAARGWRPGIVSRGYHGSAEGAMAVTAQTDPALSGDEPLLLARACSAPVYVCRNRAHAGQALLAAHPDVNVILCDDGLQHYRLARDIELCVIDGARGLGNRRLLPAGPLREPVTRLRQVDAVIVNGESRTAQHRAQFQMRLQPGAFYRLDGSAETEDLAHWQGLRLAAVCGIANPQRFFNTLHDLGLSCAQFAFPDHHAFTRADLPEADLILLTEKDAVKIAALPDLGAVGAKIRVLPVAAKLEPDLTDWLIGKLNHGRQTT